MKHYTEEAVVQLLYFSERQLDDQFRHLADLARQNFSGPPRGTTEGAEGVAE